MSGPNWQSQVHVLRTAGKYRIYQHQAAEIGIPAIRAREIGKVQCRVEQLRAAEVRLIKLNASEFGQIQACLPQVGTCEVSIRQVGSDQIRAPFSPR